MSRAARTSRDVKAIGVVHTLPNQYRHGGYLDTASDEEHKISAFGTFEMGDFAARHYGSQPIIEVVLPGGIGDVSWCYSKLSKLSAIASRPVLAYVADGQPRRGGDMLRIVPNLKFGGYATGIDNNEVIRQTLPADWPAHHGLGPLLSDGRTILRVSPNLHLEQGRPLRDWLPLLPTDYHYDLCLPQMSIDEGESTRQRLGKPIVVVYTSNRDKQKYRRGGWALWSSREWVDALRGVAAAKELKRPTFVFIGARYDADMTNEVAAACRRQGLKTLVWIGKPLGTVAALMQRSQFMLSYPSGMGILANVVRLPCLMLLPWYLKGLAEAYADPLDMATNTYRAWARPTVDEAVSWFRDVAVYQLPL